MFEKSAEAETVERGRVDVYLRGSRDNGKKRGERQVGKERKTG